MSTKKTNGYPRTERYGKQVRYESRAAAVGHGVLLVGFLVFMLPFIVVVSVLEVVERRVD